MEQASKLIMSQHSDCLHSYLVDSPNMLKCARTEWTASRVFASARLGPWLWVFSSSRPCCWPIDLLCDTEDGRAPVLTMRKRWR